MSETVANVLILDDDDDLREGLSWLFESADMQAKAYSGFEQLRLDLDELVASGAPLCLLLDLRMPSMSGLEVFAWLKARDYSLHRLPVIFLTGHGDISTAVEAVKNGAFDFYEKPATDQRLIERVRQALEHSQKKLNELAVTDEWKERLARLSPREKEVMALVARGMLNKVIAAELNISMRTVEVHRSNVFEKLKVRSAAELATLLSRLEPAEGESQLSGAE